MTVQSGFFSDGSSYNQADFNAFLLDSIGSGYVLGYENELEVTPNTPANMGVLVRTGRCYVQGYYGWVTGNEALTVPKAHTTLPRIDRVVARLSVSVNQSVTFAVLTGTPAANPSAPALTRTSETYEISLARIYVGAGVTSIVAANITDERGDATVCGVAGVKHSWQYLTNVAIDVSGMSVDAGVSDRDPVYFNGTKWVVATKGAVGFYDYRHDAVITAGYLDGFTGLTPGAIVGNRGVALSANEIVVLDSPINNSGVKQVGAVTGTFTGNLIGSLERVASFTSDTTDYLLLPATSGFTGTYTWDKYILYNTVKIINTTNTKVITIGVTTGFNACSTTITMYNINNTLLDTKSISCTSGSAQTKTLDVTIPATTTKIVISHDTSGPNTSSSWSAVYLRVANS